jgi:hypothetical protein
VEGGAEGEKNCLSHVRAKYATGSSSSSRSSSEEKTLINRGCCNLRLSRSTQAACASSMQLPMVGVYSTRSATTKPTGKKRFEAGRKVMAAQPTLMNIAGERARERSVVCKIAYVNTARETKKESVIILRVSKRDLIRGMVSWPQSQSSGCGTSSMKALTGTR